MQALLPPPAARPSHREHYATVNKKENHMQRQPPHLRPRRGSTVQCKTYGPKTERTYSEEKGHHQGFFLLDAIYKYLLLSSETSLGGHTSGH